MVETAVIMYVSLSELLQQNVDVEGRPNIVVWPVWHNHLVTTLCDQCDTHLVTSLCDQCDTTIWSQRCVTNVTPTWSHRHVTDVTQPFGHIVVWPIWQPFGHIVVWLIWHPFGHIVVWPMWHNNFVISLCDKLFSTRTDILWSFMTRFWLVVTREQFYVPLSSGVQFSKLHSRSQTPPNLLPGG